MEKDILNAVESKDLVKPEKIKFEDKNLDQMTLPERVHTLNEMMSMIEENEELTDKEKSIVDKVQGSIETKALTWAYIIKKIQDAQELIDSEIEHYKKKIAENTRRKQVLQNRINPRAEFLSQLMHQIGKKKIEGHNYSVILKTQQDELKFDTESGDIDWSKYPENLYEKVPESTKPKKKELKDYLKTHKSDDFSMMNKPLKLIVK
jgi:hypothetical protein